MRNIIPKNKRGAEMTIGTIVIIILALVVLVILVYGFSTGWSNLWQKITGFGGGDENVQTVVQSCQLACTTGSQYDWCKNRTVNFGEGKTNQSNCSTMAKGKGDFKNIDLEDCGGISCESGK